MKRYRLKDNYTTASGDRKRAASISQAGLMSLDTYTYMFPEQREICVNYLNEIIKKSSK